MKWKEIDLLAMNKTNHGEVYGFVTRVTVLSLKKGGSAAIVLDGTKRRSCHVERIRHVYE